MKINVNADQEFSLLEIKRPIREMSIRSEEYIGTKFPLRNFGGDGFHSSQTKSAQTKQLKKNRNKKELATAKEPITKNTADQKDFAEKIQKDLSKLYYAIKQR